MRVYIYVVRRIMRGSVSVACKSDQFCESNEITRRHWAGMASGMWMVWHRVTKRVRASGGEELGKRVVDLRS